ncbi:hypothetical protein FA13DRAFT_1734012 [Coprinellus micaceus]|uniref:DUF1640-domain-containing protein n=1 Tax=Coprinellus micaceus TaxID=71717 RepID=A0A4Y7T9B7_COPMI|nr:hypothetical protein FA13DRAFT_1734012 [Coprinellus micaceus]
MLLRQFVRRASPTSPHVLASRDTAARARTYIPKDVGDPLADPPRPSVSMSPHQRDPRSSIPLPPPYITQHPPQQDSGNPSSSSPQPSPASSNLNGTSESPPPNPDSNGAPPSTERGLVQATGLLSGEAGRNSSPTYTAPPFNTHTFFAALEKTFPESTARSLMRATRALLVDRIGKVRREGLTQKDLDNQAYLFRAALNELKNEITAMTKNDSAGIRTTTTALRREFDKLDVKMKEDVQNLKHEIQMELDTRKNEARTELKHMDIEIEELLNRTVVTVSELRTDVEEMKWDITRKAVGTLALFVIATIISMELKSLTSEPSKPTSPPSPSPSPTAVPPAQGSEWAPTQP